MSYLVQEERKKVTLATIHEKKAKGEKLSRTALYDYPMACLADEAGIEIINMGDSIATVMLGENSTIKATLDVMIEHAKAVRRGAPHCFIMGDMPYMTYQCSPEEAVKNASRYMIEADMDCVKMEGGSGDRSRHRGLHQGRHPRYRPHRPDPPERRHAGRLQDPGPQRRGRYEADRGGGGL